MVKVLGDASSRFPHPVGEKNEKIVFPASLSFSANTLRQSEKLRKNDSNSTLFLLMYAKFPFHESCGLSRISHQARRLLALVPHHLAIRLLASAQNRADLSASKSQDFGMVPAG